MAFSGICHSSCIQMNQTTIIRKSIAISFPISCNIYITRNGGKNMNVVIYARFSSHSQTEQSIEGQLNVCHEYARSHGFIVINEYIDRAQSGTSDNRSNFQRMINDSVHHTFQGVLVYQLDRFARNRYDSAIYKARLKKNGVRVMRLKRISPMTHRAFWSKVFLRAWRNTIQWSHHRRFYAA